MRASGRFYLSACPWRLWCKRFEVEPSRRREVALGSRSENRIPNLGSRVSLGAQSTEFELTLPDPMHKFDAGDRRCGLAEMLEAEHRTEPKLDRSMILFDQIVQIF